MSDGDVKVGNPAVVGLAGFGLTTMILQVHTVGWCGLEPVVVLAFVFGGLAQMIAGFHEFKRILWGVLDSPGNYLYDELF